MAIFMKCFMFSKTKRAYKILPVFVLMMSMLSPSPALAESADIIIVVDTSDKMGLEAAEVQNNLNVFANALVSENVNARIILISADSTVEGGLCIPAPLGSGNCPVDENLPGFMHVYQPVGSSNGLDLIISTHDIWKSQLRGGASKSFLIVSNDNSALSAESFTNMVSNLTPAIKDFRFYAIATAVEGNSFGCAIRTGATCADAELASCCGIEPGRTPMGQPIDVCVNQSEDIGEEYISLVNDTDGIFGDLCTQDFDQEFADFATDILMRSGSSQVCFPIKTETTTSVVCL